MPSLFGLRGNSIASMPASSVPPTGVPATAGGAAQGTWNLPMPAFDPAQPTSIIQAERSPELEANIAEAIDRINALSKSFTEAYETKGGTYADMINALTNIYQSRAGAEAGAASQAALTSGLTPLEAGGQAREVKGALLQEMYPQLAGLRAEEAQTLVDLQAAIQTVNQQYQDLIQSVVAPYQQAVAGTKEYDILGRETLMSNIALQQQQMAQDWREAMLNANIQQQQLNAQLQMHRENLRQRADEFSKTLGLQKEQLSSLMERFHSGEENAMDRLLVSLDAQAKEGKLSRDQQIKLEVLRSMIQKDKDLRDQAFKNYWNAVTTSVTMRGQDLTNQTAIQRAMSGGMDEVSIRQFVKAMGGKKGDELVPIKDPNKGIGLEYTKFISPTPGIYYAVKDSEVRGIGKTRGTKAADIQYLYNAPAGSRGGLRPTSSRMYQTRNQYPALAPFVEEQTQGLPLIDMSKSKYAEFFDTRFGGGTTEKKKTTSPTTSTSLVPQPNPPSFSDVMNQFLGGEEKTVPARTDTGARKKMGTVKIGDKLITLYSDRTTTVE